VLEEPEAKDYAAARSYLSLFVPEAELDELIEGLTQAPVGSWRAKDICAPRTATADEDREHRGRGEAGPHQRRDRALADPAGLRASEVVVQIADGYTALRAFLTDEDSLVPGRLLMLGQAERPAQPAG